MAAENVNLKISYVVIYVRECMPPNNTKPICTSCTEWFLQLKLILKIFFTISLLFQCSSNLHIYIFHEIAKLGSFQDGCLAPVLYTPLIQLDFKHILESLTEKAKQKTAGGPNPGVISKINR